MAPGTSPVGLDESTLKQYVADELERVRDRSFGLTTQVLDESELLAQHSRLMSPLVWDLAHVGNYEELWLLREAARIEAMRPELDDIYDAFEHPRATRPTLPLLRPDEADDYIGLVRRKVLDALDTIRIEGSGDELLDAGFVFGMVLQHEHQHDETMLATHQLRRGEPVFPVADALPAPGALITSAEVLVPAGPFTMGTSTDAWALDNERPAHQVDLPAYAVDTVPVSNAAYRAFVEAGGYDDERLWAEAGWRWRCESGKRGPAFWFRDGGSWLRRRFGRVEPLPDDEPVQHVNWYEADAYARWAGRRLPTEAEWEKAASWDPATRTKRRFPWGDEAPTDRHANLGQHRYHPVASGSFPDGAAPSGALQMVGDVWEWTATELTGYPGFRSFPYREYSEVFFDDGYRVLRGGSWATDPLACRTTFRNWDFPIRRQIFSGFRTARDA
ncbi:MAG: ergothioneine biosynthesis protein EgtB [Nocardioidaceae bacterium]|nr:ergothioneine biosynthesis protein EgtB [Nocardioidaceae bacterium]NUS51500.1 ergothioneine biosynthesis protein EgtB [Nocardioidaceae bacterium]